MPTPKFYSLILFILIFTLTGCELSRNNQTSDLEAVGEPPTPTLASLGVDSADLPVEATPIPTIINVQPTATESLLGEGQAADSPLETLAPTSQPVNLGVTPAANNQAAAASANTEAIAPETFTPPVAEKASAEESPIIVNATSTELPDSGPIAANPPAAEVGGNYGSIANDGPYVVQAGDTLFSISMRYGMSVEEFMYANGLTSDMIYAGQVLTIPGSSGAYGPPTQPVYESQPIYAPMQPGNDGYHVVSTGETLFSIAQRYGSSVEAIAGANGLVYPYLIYEGQSLILPAYGLYPAAPPADGGYYAPPVDNGYYYGTQEPAYPLPPDGYYQPQEAYPAPGGVAGTHTVVPGETLYSIANRYGTTAQAIATANGLSNPNQIYVGQVLYLP
ncbi:MAG: LysM peptidoglycan-binding domain-containing protein [Anaerolineae bacterium]|nr:LysM peptidoglycan-binding domain-containing protein [Anaerolineae bacterium]